MTVLNILPSPEQVKAVRKAAARGVRPATIAERVFGSGRGHHNLVRQIIEDPSRFSHDVDDVAVERALLGDPGVWDSLTHLEKRVVLQRALDRRRVELAENQEWSEFYRRHRNGATHSDRRKGDQPFPHSFHAPVWAEDLVKAAGFGTFARLSETARRAERRGGRVAV